MAFGRTVKSLGVASSELSLPVPRVGAVRTTTVDEPVQRACRTRVASALFGLTADDGSLYSYQWQPHGLLWLRTMR